MSRNDFERDHKRYHRRDKEKRSELDVFHDHYGRADEHEDDGHTSDLHRFHTGHRFALVGNPNCGKTTLFNYLTGSSQYVGNWPGVTVEKKEGKSKMGGENLTIVDLPGIYSLSPYTAEEVVSRNFILEEKPELIINIVDATNIERNLYLTTQLLELRRPMIVALNMVDMARSRGDAIDTGALSELLGVPVVPITASKGEGVMKLMHKAHKIAEEELLPQPRETYSGELLECLKEIGTLIFSECQRKSYPLVWSEIKLFEGEQLTADKLGLSGTVRAQVDEVRSRIHTDKYTDYDIIISDARYSFIASVCAKAIKKSYDPLAPTVSDRIDAVATNRVLAIPFFLLVMGLIFYLTFGPVGSFLSEKMGLLIDYIGAGAAPALTSLGASEWTVSLVCDGVIAGVGAVLSFLPQIALLFFFLSILEDSGYMARAAFIMDKLLRRLGLSGKSFVPMLMGFGCTVPAVMCTRTLENEKDKRATILITPFMSCSAKMPVYAMLTAAFFPRHGGLVVIGVYALGILVAALSAKLFNRTILKGEAASFVMELPAYRLPTARGLWTHVWERLHDFITKAGSVILGATIVVWFLQRFTPSLSMTSDPSESILGAVGSFIAPIFAPAGFGTWEHAVSLLTGIIGKEQVVSTMAVLHGSEEGITSALQGSMSTLGALAYLAFIMLYTPCLAAIATMRRELRSGRWTAFAIVYQLAVAWLAATAIYQLGSLF